MDLVGVWMPFGNIVSPTLYDVETLRAQALLANGPMAFQRFAVGDRLGPYTLRAFTTGAATHITPGGPVATTAFLMRVDERPGEVFVSPVRRNSPLSPYALPETAQDVRVINALRVAFTTANLQYTQFGFTGIELFE
jgi:hypothetical protein